MSKSLAKEFSELDLTRAEIESMVFEPGQLLSIRLFNRSGDGSLLYLDELSFFRAIDCSIVLRAMPWPQGVMRNAGYSSSAYLDEARKGIAKRLNGSPDEFQHFHIEVGESTFEVIAESFAINRLDIISK